MSGKSESALRGACAIVIRCRNEDRHIGKLLDGIMRQSVREPEIVIVDSGSTDETLSVVSHYPVKVVHIAPEQFSFGGALNLGFCSTSAEIVVAVSAHCYPVYEDWLDHLLRPFVDEDVAVVYGRQKGGETTKFSETQIFSKWFPPEEGGLKNGLFCNNANAAIRRKVWEGLRFDEELTGLEDIEFAKRATVAGFRTIYAPLAEVVHVHEETARGVFRRYKREGMAMRKIFPDERLSLLSAAGLLASNVLSDYLHAGAEGCFLRNAVTIPIFRTMQFAGTWAGLKSGGLVDEDLRRRLYYPRGFPRRNAKPGGRAGSIDYAAGVRR